MRKFLLLFLLILAIMLSASGQSGNYRVKLYDSWYYLKSTKTNFNPQLTAYTYEFGDSSVTIISKDSYMQNLEISPEDLKIIPVEEINTMMFRMKGSKMIGFGLGITGVIVGAVVGATLDAEPWAKPFLMIGCAAMGGGIGFGIGLPLSSIKTVFRIRGDVKTYRERRLEMIKYSIKYYTD